MPEDNSSISSSSSQSSKRYPVIPDGGYGWVITFASFMCHFIADGIAFTFGVIYTELLVEFEASKSATSWIGSLFVGVPLIFAPVAGLFTNKYGCRVTTIIGGIISSAGLLMSSYARTVEVMSITYGVIAGIGLSFVYVPSSVIPSFWFEKKRSLATGIAVSGSGIGTFAMAPLMEYLITEYSWRGAMLILSAITLNILVFGALFRPVPEADEPLCNEGEELQSISVIPTVKATSTVTSFRDMISLSTLSIPAKFPSQDIPTDLLDQEKPLMINTATSTMVCSAESLDDFTVAKHKRRRHHSFRHANHHHQGIPLNQLRRSNRSLLPLSRRDITSVLTLAEKQRFTTSCPELFEPSLSSADGATSTSKRERIVKILKKVAFYGREMCDIRLFKVPVYFLFFMSNFIMSYAYDLPYVYLPDYAAEQGVTNESFLISIIGIVNMFGQILYGFLGDHKKINTVILYGVSIVGCGVLIAVLPVMKSYSLLASACGLFGLLISANFALETIVVVQILSLEELTKAYSLLMFGQGVAALIGPPIGGKRSDLILIPLRLII